MSAGSQIQMAPQATVNSGQPVHSQDSNMSTGMFESCSLILQVYARQHLYHHVLGVPLHMSVLRVEVEYKESLDFTKTKGLSAAFSPVVDFKYLQFSICIQFCQL
jgi:hypothetical protein